MHVDQQKADTHLTFVFLAGTYQTEYPVRVLGKGRPGFDAIDEVVIAFVLGLGSQGGEIGSRPRFRIALAPPDVGVEDIRQEFLFLLFRAELHDYRSNHRDAERHNPRRAGLRRLQVEYVTLRGGKFRAAKLRRPVRGGPALLGQHLLPANVVFLTQTARCTALGFIAHLLRPGSSEPGAHFLLKSTVFVAESQVHIHLRRNNPTNSTLQRLRREMCMNGTNTSGGLSSTA